ncbi:hypothetical protein CDD80_1631 [Ophiocordyceps camponoti-rufipedis]|uniref:Uncharacterized protein n=1 Tax=Ophiocordyceps camponoti-rufipedis TaxID=2004952 RepID=A0A2C5ZHC5_9HYPO|nr:hypothetical protein CDD80_1631 [Ophiocordyceps camponoti-rufipedis]
MKPFFSFGILLALASASPLQRRADTEALDSKIDLAGFAQKCLAGRQDFKNCRVNTNVPTDACEDKAESTEKKPCQKPVKEGVVKIDLKDCDKSFTDQSPSQEEQKKDDEATKKNTGYGNEGDKAESTPTTAPSQEEQKTQSTTEGQIPSNTNTAAETPGQTTSNTSTAVETPGQTTGNTNTAAETPGQTTGNTSTTAETLGQTISNTNTAAETPGQTTGNTSTTAETLGQTTSNTNTTAETPEQTTIPTPEAQETTPSSTTQAPQTTPSTENTQSTSTTADSSQPPPPDTPTPVSITDSQQTPGPTPTTSPATDDSADAQKDVAPLPEDQVKRALQTAQDSPFKSNGDRFAFTNVPDEVRRISMWLVFKFQGGQMVEQFEPCGPQDHGRIVMILGITVVYGKPEGLPKEGPEGTSVTCFNEGSWKNVTVRDNAVVSSTPLPEAEAKDMGVPVGDCTGTKNCKTDKCQGDNCLRGLVNKLQPAPASAQPGQPDTKPTDLTPSRQITYIIISTLEVCKSDCNTKFCGKDNECKPQEPREGIASQPVQPNEVKPLTQKVLEAANVDNPKIPSSGQSQQGGESPNQATPPQEQRIPSSNQAMPPNEQKVDSCDGP